MNLKKISLIFFFIIFNISNVNAEILKFFDCYSNDEQPGVGNNVKARHYELNLKASTYSVYGIDSDGRDFLTTQKIIITGSSSFMIKTKYEKKDRGVIYQHEEKIFNLKNGSITTDYYDAILKSRKIFLQCKKWPGQKNSTNSENFSKSILKKLFNK